MLNAVQKHGTTLKWTNKNAKTLEVWQSSQAMVKACTFVGGHLSEVQLRVDIWECY